MCQTGRLDNLQLSCFGSMSNSVSVLATGPPSLMSTVDPCVDAGIDCESSELSLALSAVCTALAVAFLLDPPWDFELVDFLAASLAALAAASICCFALFKVEDSPRWASTNSTSCPGRCSSSSLGVPVTLNGVVARRRHPADRI